MVQACVVVPRNTIRNMNASINDRGLTGGLKTASPTCNLVYVGSGRSFEGAWPSLLMIYRIQAGSRFTVSSSRRNHGTYGVVHDPELERYLLGAPSIPEQVQVQVQAQQSGQTT